MNLIRKLLVAFAAEYKYFWIVSIWKLRRHCLCRHIALARVNIK